MFRTLVCLKSFFAFELQLGDRDGKESTMLSADGLSAHGAVAPKPLVGLAGYAVLDSFAKAGS